MTKDQTKERPFPTDPKQVSAWARQIVDEAIREIEVASGEPVVFFGWTRNGNG